MGILLGRALAAVPARLSSMIPSPKKSGSSSKSIVVVIVSKNACTLGFEATVQRYFIGAYQVFQDSHLVASDASFPLFKPPFFFPPPRHHHPPPPYPNHKNQLASPPLAPPPFF